MSRSTPLFVGTCVHLRADDLEEFDDSSREITYRTFRRHLGSLVDELDRSFGVPLRTDWHVSYLRGKWKGKAAICLMHSQIHHIWLLPKAQAGR
jgi:hypothetical protein